MHVPVRACTYTHAHTQAMCRRRDRLGLALRCFDSLPELDDRGPAVSKLVTCEVGHGGIGTVFVAEDLHAIGSVPRVATRGPGQRGGEGLHQIIEAPGQHHDVIGVAVEDDHHGGVAQAWGAGKSLCPGSSLASPPLLPRSADHALPVIPAGSLTSCSPHLLTLTPLSATRPFCCCPPRPLRAPNFPCTSAPCQADLSICGQKSDPPPAPCFLPSEKCQQLTTLWPGLSQQMRLQPDSTLT